MASAAADVVVVVAEAVPSLKVLVESTSDLEHVAAADVAAVAVVAAAAAAAWLLPRPDVAAFLSTYDVQP